MKTINLIDALAWTWIAVAVVSAAVVVSASPFAAVALWSSAVTTYVCVLSE